MPLLYSTTVPSVVVVSFIVTLFLLFVVSTMSIELLLATSSSVDVDVDVLQHHKYSNPKTCIIFGCMESSAAFNITTTSSSSITTKINLD